MTVPAEKAIDDSNESTAVSADRDWSRGTVYVDGAPLRNGTVFRRSSWGSGHSRSGAVHTDDRGEFELEDDWFETGSKHVLSLSRPGYLAVRIHVTGGPQDLSTDFRFEPYDYSRSCRLVSEYGDTLRFASCDLEGVLRYSSREGIVPLGDSEPGQAIWVRYQEFSVDGERRRGSKILPVPSNEQKRGLVRLAASGRAIGIEFDRPIHHSGTQVYARVVPALGGPSHWNALTLGENSVGTCLAGLPSEGSLEVLAATFTFDEKRFIGLRGFAKIDLSTHEDDPIRLVLREPRRISLRITDSDGALPAQVRATRDEHEFSLFSEPASRNGRAGGWTIRSHTPSFRDPWRTPELSAAVHRRQGSDLHELTYHASIPYPVILYGPRGAVALTPAQLQELSDGDRVVLRSERAVFGQVKNSGSYDHLRCDLRGGGHLVARPDPDGNFVFYVGDRHVSHLRYVRHGGRSEQLITPIVPTGERIDFTNRDVKGKK